MTVRRQRFLALAVGLGLAIASVGATTASSGGVPGREIYMPTRGMVESASHSNGHKPGGGGSNNLSYGGGVSIGGVNTGVVAGTAKVYLVLWGSQWSSDPSNESTLLQSFLSKVGGSAWNNSVTQYCQGVARGTTTCAAGTTRASNQSGIFSASNQLWADNGSAAPSSPTQSQLAAEAVAAALHFGNTTATSNTHVQYVIATAHNNNMSGFGTQWCAWHSSAGYAGGYVAYTNLPYMTDAGSSCGANFNGLGASAGVTIVEGHELAETETDIYPNVGWLDSRGAENGDKCAWNAATSSQPMGGSSFPVQPLWSNAANGGAGGCALSY